MATISEFSERISKRIIGCRFRYETQVSGKIQWVPVLKHVAKKVCAVATVIFIAVAATALFFYNIPCFAAGFLVGCAKPRDVKEFMDNVKNGCKDKPWAVPILLVGSLFAWFLVLPVGSFTCGAYLGRKFVTVEVKEAAAEEQGSPILE